MRHPPPRPWRTPPFLRLRLSSRLKPRTWRFDPTTDEDVEATPEAKLEPTPKDGGEATDTDKRSEATASSEGRQTRSQPSESIPQTATEYTWQDGDRTLRVTVQPDLVLQDDASSADKGGPTVETGKGVIVRKSDTSDKSGQPVFRSPSSALMTLPGGVLLVLEDAWTEAEVNSFFARNSIKRDRVSELSYATNGFFVETEIRNYSGILSDDHVHSRMPIFPSHGGEGGIRTHDPLRDTAFRVRRLRPLGHLSEPPTILHLRPFLVDLPFSLTSARVVDSMRPVDDDAIGATA